MTLRGWIGYLKCWFFGHKLLALKRRHGQTKWVCQRCPHPYDHTLKDRLRQLRENWQRWQKPQKPDEHDDLPF